MRLSLACGLVAGLLAVVLAVVPSPQGRAATSAPILPANYHPPVTPSPLPSPDRLLYLIRRQFRSHRPPPPYETYTLVRSQLTDYGNPPYPDLVNSYTYHIWCRTYDDACLGRKVYRGDARGYLEFLRPAFNEDRDPGPPTADLFQKAPAHFHPVSESPTPEPTGTLPPVIASVTVFGEFDYRVTRVAIEGDLIHVSVVPRRDPNRNRLREIYVDRTTLELKRIIATDKLFEDEGGGRMHVYALHFTINLSMLDGIPVVTSIHGEPTRPGDAEYLGNGGKVDYTFENIAFPKTLPAWYFDPHQYAQHQNDAPL